MKDNVVNTFVECLQPIESKHFGKSIFFSQMSHVVYK